MAGIYAILIILGLLIAIGIGALISHYLQADNYKLKRLIYSSLFFFTFHSIPTIFSLLAPQPNNFMATDGMAFELLVSIIFIIAGFLSFFYFISCLFVKDKNKKGILLLAGTLMLLTIIYSIFLIVNHL